jgi:hypothetical protein
VLTPLPRQRRAGPGHLFRRQRIPRPRSPCLRIGYRRRSHRRAEQRRRRQRQSSESIRCWRNWNPCRIGGFSPDLIYGERVAAGLHMVLHSTGAFGYTRCGPADTANTRYAEAWS